ncbi:hypothetical protein MABM_37150 [Mycobacteroides abscessus]|uniref:Amidohydrolase orfA n=1 Tax=Mycobacteroides abscessus subsp. bolletii 50594 TaxID=1303024 RepID=A0AB33AHZ8_9MYCO|nr:putative amidohydrolase orfA [Mycobacteroides abscessus subsp. bolletii 50594]BBZ83799.1 hypothetical protein MABM_37150 [Mycobacteroides abscessus]
MPESAFDPAPVRQIWQELGIPGIVDVHTHFMPKSVMDKVWAYFDSAGPLVGRPWPITYRAEESQRVTTLRDFGVLRFTSLVYPHKPQMAAWLNQWAGQFAAQTPDCIHTATFFPEPGAADYVREAIDAGVGVFKGPHSGRCLLPDRSAAGPGVGPHRGRRRSGGDPLRVWPGTGRIHRS